MGNLKHDNECMQLRYGSFLFQRDSCEMRLFSDVGYTDADEPATITSRAEVVTYVTSDETDPLLIQKDLSAKELLIRAALSYNFRDLVLMCDDGTPSSCRLLNAGSVTGVRIMSVSTPEGTGPQFASFRTIQFTAEAQYEIVPGFNYLVSYQETVSYIGNGGPAHVVVPTLDGLLVRQVTTPVTPFRASQTGTAVGLLATPNFGGPSGAVPPRWPMALLNENSTVARTSPQRRGLRSINYGVQWSYQYWSETPFLAYQPEWGG